MTKSERVAIYPGSFDPITNGHVDIIKRSCALFDKLILLIASTPSKQALFSVQERMEMMRESADKICSLPELQDQVPQIEVGVCEGLLMDYAKKIGVRAVVRGLRAVADFEYEFQMASINKKLNPDCETVFVMTGEPYYYVSSSIVKEVASFGGTVSDLVPLHVQKQLIKKFKDPLTN